MPGQTDGRTEGQTDPILYDPSGYRRGSEKTRLQCSHFLLKLQAFSLEIYQEIYLENVLL